MFVPFKRKFLRGFGQSEIKLKLNRSSIASNFIFPSAYLQTPSAYLQTTYFKTSQFSREAHIQKSRESHSFTTKTYEEASI